MSRELLLVGTVLLVTAVAAAWTFARESPPDLVDEATISFDVARVAALTAVPGGRIVDEDLEREGGHLIYAFDVVAPGDGGVRDVEIDALTGVLLQNVPDDDDPDDDDDDDDDGDDDDDEGDDDDDDDDEGAN